MTEKQIKYQDARKLMQPGDVIAFGGKGHFSELIKLGTFSSVSHVGVIIQTRIPEDDTDRFFNQIIESTSLHGFNGVNISRFSDRLDSYEGELWWLPLKEKIRQTTFDKQMFFDFLLNQAKARKPYDMPQAIKSPIDLLDNLPLGLHGAAYNQEDFSKFFCSELVAAGLEIAGAVDCVNASEVTPIDLCRWAIYEDTYFQLKGESSKRITRFNTANPADWNV